MSLYLNQRLNPIVLNLSIKNKEKTVNTRQDQKFNKNSK